MTIELLMFDFDGTLAYRPGMWTQCIHDVITRHFPDHATTIEDLRPHLRDGFPWHRPEVAHPELADPGTWWRALGPLLDRISRSVGIGTDYRSAFREHVRSHYCDPTHFELYLDTRPALELLPSTGVRAVILSNHVPELGSIVSHLGLDRLVDDVFSSARIGFEKPHPEAFRKALGTTPPARACMVGDNPTADRQGAVNAGLRALLVRHDDADHDNVINAVEEALSW